MHRTAYFRPDGCLSWNTEAKLPLIGIGRPHRFTAGIDAWSSRSLKHVRGFWIAWAYSWPSGHLGIFGRSAPRRAYACHGQVVIPDSALAPLQFRPFVKGLIIEFVKRRPRAPALLM